MPCHTARLTSRLRTVEAARHAAELAASASARARAEAEALATQLLEETQAHVQLSCQLSEVLHDHRTLLLRFIRHDQLPVLLPWIDEMMRTAAASQRTPMSRCVPMTTHDNESLYGTGARTDEGMVINAESNNNSNSETGTSMLPPSFGAPSPRFPTYSHFTPVRITDRGIASLQYVPQTDNTTIKDSHATSVTDLEGHEFPVSDVSRPAAFTSITGAIGVEPSREESYDPVLPSAAAPPRSRRTHTTPARMPVRGTPHPRPRSVAAAMHTMQASSPSPSAAPEHVSFPTPAVPTPSSSASPTPLWWSPVGQARQSGAPVTPPSPHTPTEPWTRTGGGPYRFRGNEPVPACLPSQEVQTCVAPRHSSSANQPAGATACRTGTEVHVDVGVAQVQQRGAPNATVRPPMQVLGAGQGVGLLAGLGDSPSPANGEDVAMGPLWTSAFSNVRRVSVCSQV